MTQKLKAALATIISLSAFSPTLSETVADQSVPADEKGDCIRKIMQLDEGRWEYFGTIATLNGKFRIYRATSVHTQIDTDTWSSQSFGGDTGTSEDSAKPNLVRLVGDRLVPIIDGTLNLSADTHYRSCSGPDPEGRYQAEVEYRIPNGDGTFDTAHNVSWYSEHGSYFTEFHVNEAGRTVARRSGIQRPAEDGTVE
ncbi:hypothetical protein [Parasphingorhabdus halotolerans]|uniref:Uncharacterized protein n=1 Tax=Parasphingorhabdus halotolerans TaxID=2725558 RepID=A0A6H2DPL6_9SPHN|nr:hypothetical protein [Parasphingorhabdus halotolerans]QJB69905.1 hypothetical protein HF685_11930 [Parasphingorhabdus halotolerans]